MAAADFADITAILKELYPKGVPRDMWYSRAPLMALMPKDQDANGELIKVPLIYGSPKGRSAAFAKARTNAAASNYGAFDVTTVDDYGVAQITGKAIDASKTDRGSFVRIVKREMDGALRQLKRSAVHALYRNGGGAIAQFDATSVIGSTVMKVRNPRDLRFLEVGMTVAVSADDGTGGAGVRAGAAVLTAVNRRTGELTTAANWNVNFAAITVNDYIFIDGDYSLKMKGMEAWVPATDPGATAFYGVNRSVDPTKLGGVRVDGTGKPIEEALIDGVEEVSTEGGEPDLIIVNPKQWATLAKALGSKAVYDKRTSDDGTIGFKSIKLATDAGDVDVVSDPNCQLSAAWVLQMDTWTLASMGDIPKVIEDDGNAYLRQHDADGIEIRCVYRANPYCEAPGWNGRISLST